MSLRPSNGSGEATKLEEDHLPDRTVSFNYPSYPRSCHGGRAEFMSLGRSKNVSVGVDHELRTILYCTDWHAIRALPDMHGGQWALPFRGNAEHVGLSRHGDQLCASDLAAAASSPPVVLDEWGLDNLGVTTREECYPTKSYLVHLGNGRFCIGKLFHVEEDYTEDGEGKLRKIRAKRYRPSSNMTIYLSPYPCVLCGPSFATGDGELYSDGDDLPLSQLLLNGAMASPPGGQGGDWVAD
uniref:Uncharacterized protein n=1 Tax=Oryza punctata TaxID=4537 RepID=A0A0E0JFV2_ORYPU